MRPKNWKLFGNFVGNSTPLSFQETLWKLLETQNSEGYDIFTYYFKTGWKLLESYQSGFLTPCMGVGNWKLSTS